MEVLFKAEADGPPEADTVAIGIFDGEDAPAAAPAQAARLLTSGEARGSLKSLALAHEDERRWLLVGLGERSELTHERARVAASTAVARARELSTRTLCWVLPDGAGDLVAGALVEGTVLGDYRFDRFKSKPDEDGPKPIERLICSFPAGTEQAVSRAAIVAAAANATRDLQNRPGNDLTPTALGDYARELVEQIDGLSATVEGRGGLAARGMGAFSAVAQGSAQEPALLTLRYEGPDVPADAPTLGFVGKAVTFDSGGISIKPGAHMSDMKFDMSGGAAVLEASAAIARLRLPVRLVSVIGATENLPGGSAVKPGDIVTAANGKTIEINNTDAEGRLVLADCLCHALAEGAQQIVDLATLTGGVIVALGSTYAGLMSNDDALSKRVQEAGENTGEIVWRLPLHEEYDALVKGRYADLDNAPEERKASAIVGAAFLSNFVGEAPWAHLDIAGSSWGLGRDYVGGGASGYGVRLLVELARSYVA